MATEWFYTSSGQKAGPVSSKELKRLATQGVLLPTDLLWKEGMKDWLPASKAKNLFTDESLGLGTDQAAQQPSPQNSLPNSEPANATEAPVTLGARMQNAARSTALKAEQAKLTNVSLPAAYLALGRHLYAGRLMAEGFPEVYRELDGLQAQVDAATKRAADATGMNLSEKAKALATKAAELAKVKAAEVQQLSLLKRLGQAACEGGGTASVAAEQLEGILTLRKRLTEINDALLQAATPVTTTVGQAASVPSKPKTKTRWPRTIKWISGLVAVLFLIGLFFGKREEGDRERQVGARLESPASAQDTVAETSRVTGDSGDSIADPTSSEYQVNKYLREMREEQAQPRDEDQAMKALLDQQKQLAEAAKRENEEVQRADEERERDWEAARKEQEAQRKLDIAAEEERRRLAIQRDEYARANPRRIVPEQSKEVKPGAKSASVAGFPVTRNWFESDEKYLQRGIKLVAAKYRGADVTKVTLRPSLPPWKGFRGEVSFENLPGLSVEAHAFPDDFIIALYDDTNWLAYGSVWLNSSAEDMTPDLYCKRAYNQTRGQIYALIEQEKSRRFFATEVWTMVNNESEHEMLKRFAKPIQLRGEVLKVEKESDGWHIHFAGLRFGGQAELAGWVDCQMLDEEDVETLSEGTDVTVEGTYKGGEKVVRLEDCRIVKRIVKRWWE